MINVVFVGIDSWNRPVFMSLTKKAFFGSTHILFDYDATEAEVVKVISANQLEYFGLRFDCEPIGGTPSEDLHIELTQDYIKRNLARLLI